MKPLPLLFEGRPIPPPPPPYQGPPAIPAASPPSPGHLSGELGGRVPAEAAARLAAIYRDVDAEIARLGPRCDARGICCDFDIVDHVLYASKLEIDFVKDRDPAARHLAASGNRCPFLEGGRCGAREHRMLGCRTYFCQEGWAPHAAEVYERHYARVKAIARDLELDWRYAPALEQFRDGS